MPSVTIDAGVLAVPPEDSPVDAANRYVETLMELSSLRNKSWVDVYIYIREQFHQAFWGGDGFEQGLKKLFVTKEVKQYSAEDVRSVVYSLFNNTALQLEEHFEKRLGVSTSEVLKDASLIKIDPDTQRLVADNAFQAGITHCLILIAILQHYEGSIHNPLLVLQYAPESTVTTVTVQAKISVGLPNCPEAFREEVLICGDFKGIIQGLCAPDIFVSSEDNEDLEAAIRIALYKPRLGKKPNWDGPLQDWDDLLQGLCIGCDFLASVRERYKQHGRRFPAEETLDAIVQTLGKENMEAAHPIRTGSGGADPQLKRKADSAGAMRRKIGNSNDFHLHYWLCKNSSVELASIGFPHDDVSIPTGGPTG